MESFVESGVQPKEANRALILVASAVLLASSTWFSGTAVTPLLSRVWSLSEAQSAWLTISVQFGFIVGTFLYALFNLADIFNARHVFFVSALLGAVSNASFAWFASNLGTALLFRFLTGVTLAGVYPVGMKIVASWFRSGLGWRLGVLVGALTLGTASPYLIRALGAQHVDWRMLVSLASLCALLGGTLMVVGLSDGPYLRQQARFDSRMLWKVFHHKPFRYTAFGYFGHMWELYAFWSLITFYLGARLQTDTSEGLELLPFLAFCTIGIGALGCILGGWISRTAGERRVALVSLGISAILCILSGLLFFLPSLFLIPLVLVWGFFVVADSPQFSALAARYCPPDYTGTALTVQNGIGFAITIVSIQLLPWIAGGVGWQWTFSFLAIGPLVGAYFMSQLDSHLQE